MKGNSHGKSVFTNHNGAASPHDSITSPFYADKF